jgi:hypothetical protein
MREKTHCAYEMRMELISDLKATENKKHGMTLTQYIRSCTRNVFAFERL